MYLLHFVQCKGACNLYALSDTPIKEQTSNIFLDVIWYDWVQRIYSFYKC